ncbi:hypothetical protein BOTBODRAFT_453145 [Botryobasidium botryosum FD-172 SS1]|uniref:Uncharacterized protein n=1 Tax=Botryobasidium botryosum (strain FD-172 SS1) TaxID=930990 RepID=A0A067M7N5_BOTB1|nr:hypothetical protein BOTBODRAFT_453145 [Botryobasidium botryosum FD-172 SS1]
MTGINIGAPRPLELPLSHRIPATRLQRRRRPLQTSELPLRCYSEFKRRQRRPRCLLPSMSSTTPSSPRGRPMPTCRPATLVCAALCSSSPSARRPWLRPSSSSRPPRVHGRADSGRSPRSLQRGFCPLEALEHGFTSPPGGRIGRRWLCLYFMGELQAVRSILPYAKG